MGNHLLSTSVANSLFSLLNIDLLCISCEKTRKVRQELKKQADETCEMLRKEIEECELITETRQECIINREILLSCEKTCDMIEAADLYLCRVLSIGIKTGKWKDTVQFDFGKFACIGDSGCLHD